MVMISSVTFFHAWPELQDICKAMQSELRILRDACNFPGNILRLSYSYLFYQQFIFKPISIIISIVFKVIFMKAILFWQSDTTVLLDIEWHVKLQYWGTLAQTGLRMSPCSANPSKQTVPMAWTLPALSIQLFIEAMETCHCDMMILKRHIWS